MSRWLQLVPAMSLIACSGSISSTNASTDAGGATDACPGVSCSVPSADAGAATDPCADVTCSGHGTCAVSTGTATCTCEAGYHPSGLSCDPDGTAPCDGVTCSGHGTCAVSNGTAACTCDPGYLPNGLACVAGTANLTVDLASPTGKTVSPYIYGLATGSLANNAFAGAADPTIKASLAKLRPTLIRINAVNQIVREWNEGNPGVMDNWWSNYESFCSPDVRLVMGLGPGGDSVSASTWAQYAQSFASAMKSAGHEIMYWEVGNENDGMDAGSYTAYFNAIADALHAVNPDYQVGGTNASWWGGIDVGAFASGTGHRAGFFASHQYWVGAGTAPADCYAEALTCTWDPVRQALAGTAIADIPMALNEYNMDGGPQPDGVWGSPEQQTYVGAVYIALLLANYHHNDPHFEMAALWDVFGDSNYGVVGGAANGYDNTIIDPQGYYLGEAGQHLPGSEVAVSTALHDLQVLATKNGSSFAIQLVNYSTADTLDVAIGLTGGTPGTVTRWEIGKSNPTAPATSTQASLSSVPLPSETIVILEGTFTP